MLAEHEVARAASSGPSGVNGAPAAGGAANERQRAPFDRSGACTEERYALL